MRVMAQAFIRGEAVAAYPVEADLRDLCESADEARSVADRLDREGAAWVGSDFYVTPVRSSVLAPRLA